MARHFWTPCIYIHALRFAWCLLLFAFGPRNYEYSLVYDSARHSLRKLNILILTKLGTTNTRSF